jgi:tRNA 2-thiouridine synthesizing protein E
MDKLTYKDKVYDTDSYGFLLDPAQWDENFAEGMAIGARIVGKLTTEHLAIINFIRESYEENASCPTVYQTCKAMNLGINELNRLFPTGYLRGACKLAGVTYKDVPPPEPIAPDGPLEKTLYIDGKGYYVDSHGFLINPDEWDEQFAEYLAAKTPNIQLTDKHWRIIKYLRQSYTKNRAVPTIYEVCEANKIGLAELEALFPDGYHRGAVKIAGLRVR